MEVLIWFVVILPLASNNMHKLLSSGQVMQHCLLYFGALFGHIALSFLYRFGTLGPYDLVKTHLPGWFSDLT